MSPGDFPPKNQAESMNTPAFRQEVEELVVRRMSIHLTELDAKMWHKLKNYTKGSITEGDLIDYINDVKKSGNAFRAELMQIIIDRLQGLWGNEELDAEQ